MVSLMITIKSKCEDIDKLYANGIFFFRQVVWLTTCLSGTSLLDDLLILKYRVIKSVILDENENSTKLRNWYILGKVLCNVIFYYDFFFKKLENIFVLNE